MHVDRETAEAKYTHLSISYLFYRLFQTCFQPDKNILACQGNTIWLQPITDGKQGYKSLWKLCFKQPPYMNIDIGKGVGIRKEPAQRL